MHIAHGHLAATTGVICDARDPARESALDGCNEHCTIWIGADPLTMTLGSDVPFADGWESGALASISAQGRGGGR